MKKGGGGSKIHNPLPAEQRQRIEAQLTALVKVHENHSGELHASAIGLAPDQVLVFEIIGSVEDFFKSVRKIEGMEWLAEWTEEDAQPDEFFFDDKDPGKALPRRLFFVAANQTAMDQLLRLWQSWQKQPTEKFPHGLAKWKSVFQQLRSIRRWGARDRLLETGALEDWQYQIAHGGGTVLAEVEFWFRSDAQARERLDLEYREVVGGANGQILAHTAIPAIGYHAVLAELPIATVAALLGGSQVLNELPLASSGGSTDWLYFDQVMQVRATGQIVVDTYSESDNVAATIDSTVSDAPPIGALLDGMPLTQHVVLRDGLVVDDPLGWADDYPPARRLHGTAMASIILRGDLNDAQSEPLRSPLYVRPVMMPRYDNSSGEHIPRQFLSTDLLYTAIRRIFEGEGSEPPSAPSVRVINISIGHVDRPFFASMSPLARLLDWVAVEYNVLVVVSAGNHGYSLTLDLPRGGAEQIASADLRTATITAVVRDARNRRLLSPAESINSLTVGAAHTDNSRAPLPQGLLDPIGNAFCPSPVSSMGFGFRRSIKPDVLAAGGRQPYRVKLGNTHTNEILQPTQSPRPFGVGVAIPGREGAVDAWTGLCGTSVAAAAVSRGAIQIIESLDRLIGDDGAPAVRDPFRSLAAKCLVPHSAAWGDSFEHIAAAALKLGGDAEQIARRLLGYGCTTGVEVTSCTDQRVTVLGLGQLGDGGAHIYEFPIPVELSGLLLWRRLTVTLAWNSPVRITHQRYRIGALWFVTGFAPLGVTRSDAHWQAVQRGTIQHEVFEGTAAVVLTGDERLRMTVNCRADAGHLFQNIPYVLAATLEVAEGVDLPIYERVRARLRQQVPLRA